MALSEIVNRICPECKTVDGIGGWWKCLNDFHREQRAAQYSLCLVCGHEVEAEGICKECEKRRVGK